MKYFRKLEKKALRVRYKDIDGRLKATAKRNGCSIDEALRIEAAEYLAILSRQNYKMDDEERTQMHDNA